MKQPLVNTTGPLRELLDDFARMPEGRRTVLAGGIALLLHGVIFLGGGAMIFRMQQHTAQPPVEKKTRLEVTLFTPPPSPKVAAATPEPKREKLTQPEETLLQEKFRQLPEEVQREFVDVEGLAQRKNLSKRALLESWADSVAGSRLPGKGENPLPAQEGEKLPFADFKNQQVSLGKTAVETSPIFQPLPVQKEELTQPSKSKPVPKVAEAVQPKPKELTATATPRPSRLVLAHAATPPPIRKTREASDDEIPLYLDKPEAKSTSDVKLRPEPTPEPPPQPTPEPKLQPTPVPTATPAPTPPDPANTIMARLPKQTRPQPVQNPGYAPHQVKTHIDGGSAPPGENGVDAIATAAGKYKKNIKSTVGSRWTYFVHNAKFSSLIVAGQTTVEVTLDRNGKILRCKVTDNTSNAAHAQICERAFLESQKDIDPPPPELLMNGVFEESYTFTLY